MSGGAAVILDDVSKRYRLGEYGAVYLTLQEALRGWVSRRRPGHVGDADERDMWALRDIKFEVGRGEALGIIGQNGAGKSTLLRIVARITNPTEGVARMRGRVGSLLEVGTGFHPELTGRENILFNGAILGMSRAEVRRRFDEIVEFAGVERFLDTPLKRWSTGMQLRLAFAVAAHLDAEIVTVDEVLSVGDAEFRRRCLERVSDIEAEGRTVLFVSHDLGAVNRVCERVIWIHGGRVVADGPAQQVIEGYLREGTESAETPESELGIEAGPIELKSIRITDGAGEWPPRRDRSLEITLRFATRREIPNLDVALWLLDGYGNRLIDDAWSDHRDGPTRMVADEEYALTAVVPAGLRPGDYVVGAWIGAEGGHDTAHDRELMRFSIVPAPDDPRELVERPRVVQPPIAWKVTRTG